MICKSLTYRTFDPEMLMVRLLTTSTRNPDMDGDHHPNKIAQ